MKPTKPKKLNSRNAAPYNLAIDDMTAYQKEREAWGLDGLKKVKEKLIDRAEKTHYPLENLSYNEIAEIIREVKETLNRFSEEE